jgi:hypothetical protein
MPQKVVFRAKKICYMLQKVVFRAINMLYAAKSGIYNKN